MPIFDREKLKQLEQAETAPAAVASVLLVDDKEANLSVMAAVLRPHFQLIEARGAQEALAALSRLAPEELPACVISDQRMPGMCGVQLLEQVQSLAPDASRIVVTGYIDIDALVDSINRAEIHKFVAKPFNADEFLATVQQGVAQWAARRAARARVSALNRQARCLTDALSATRAELEEAREMLERQAATLRSLESELARLRGAPA